MCNLQARPSRPGFGGHDQRPRYVVGVGGGGAALLMEHDGDSTANEGLREPLDKVWCRVWCIPVPSE